MNSMLRVILLLVFLLLHTGVTSLSVPFSSTQYQPIENDKELSCELFLPSEVHPVEDYFDAELVITNISDHLVKICDLTQEWRLFGRTDYTAVLRPDFWKSDSPRPEDFPRHIIPIEPGKSVSFPLKIRYHDEFLRAVPLRIQVGYETQPAFANRYGTWSGSIQSKPVFVKVIE